MMKDNIDLQKLVSEDNYFIIHMSEYCINRRVHINEHFPGLISSYHTHDFYELNYVYEGQCRSIVNGNEIFMERGDAILMHPGTFHRIDEKFCGKVYNILIAKNFFEFTFVSANKDTPLGQFVLAASQNSHYRYLMFKDGVAPDGIINKMLEIGSSTTPERELLLEAYTGILLGTLSETKRIITLSRETNKSSEIMYMILQYMYEKYDVVTLKSMSEKFSYTKSHICRLFKHFTGKNFSEILNDIKLSYALQYLTRSNMTIHDASSKSGFVSVEHFHRIFKKNSV